MSSLINWQSHHRYAPKHSQIYIVHNEAKIIIIWTPRRFKTKLLQCDSRGQVTPRTGLQWTLAQLQDIWCKNKPSHGSRCKPYHSVLSVESFGRIFTLWIPDNLPNQQSCNLIILHIFTHVRRWSISSSSLHNFFEGHYDLTNFRSHCCMWDNDDRYSIRISYSLFFYTYRTLSNYIYPNIFSTQCYWNLLTRFWKTLLINTIWLLHHQSSGRIYQMTSKTWKKCNQTTLWRQIHRKHPYIALALIRPTHDKSY